MRKLSPGFLGEMSKAVSNKRAHVTLAQTSGTCPRNVQCPNAIYPDGMSMVVTGCDSQHAHVSVCIICLCLKETRVRLGHVGTQM